jgi:type VI protein secretion system component VasK
MSDIVRQSPLDKQILLLVQQKLCQKPNTSSTVDSKLLQSTVVNAVLAYDGESLNYSDGSIDFTS